MARYKLYVEAELTDEGKAATQTGDEYILQAVSTLLSCLGAEGASVRVEDLD